jgi:hypothetical protein
MTETVQIALIATIAPTIAAIAGIVISWLNSRRNSRKIDEVILSTNGMKDELIKTTDLAAQARGHLQGTTDEKARQEKERFNVGN